MNDELEAQAQEAGPDEVIAEFHVGRRDYKKAKKMRAFLAADAPALVGDTIIRVPIEFQPRIRKNRMYAVAGTGERILEINLKSGEINFVIPEVE